MNCQVKFENVKRELNLFGYDLVISNELPWCHIIPTDVNLISGYILQRFVKDFGITLSGCSVVNGKIYALVTL